MSVVPITHSAPYGRVLDKIGAGRCVVLDGATGTELPHLSDAEHAVDERLWGTRALVEEAAAVRDVHREYVATGCDVISTNTWGLPSALLNGVAPHWSSTQPVHWMDLARRGLRLARQAVTEGDRDESCAVAFSINGDVDSEEGESTIRLLARLFAHEPPDLILLETLTVVRPSLFATVQALLDTGLPVWLSFRRCRHGLCSVYGQHWGGPEGDSFGRAAARFEQMGIDALMINCIPPDHVDGMLSYLRDFTDLPLGVYPNLGYYTDEGWRFEPGVGSAEYAAMALRWRAEGAQIIGGCCGVGPDHVAAAREQLEQAPVGSATSPEPRAPAADAFLEEEPSPLPPGPITAAARCIRCRFRTSRSTPGWSRRPAPASWSGATSTTRPSGRISAAWTSAAAPASSASSSRSTGRRTCAPSTSTSAPCATPRPTRIETASATA